MIPLKRKNEDNQDGEPKRIEIGCKLCKQGFPNSSKNSTLSQ